MVRAHVMGELSERRAGADGSGRPAQRGPGHDERRPGDTGVLYEQVRATRERSALLAQRLQATQHRSSENWQLIRDAWGRAERIRAGRIAAGAGPDWLRYSAYARLQARLASLPVIEQAKGIIMAQYGWPEEQAFEALRRVSQQRNIKVRELATSIVARTRRPVPAQRQPQRQPPRGRRPG